MASVSEAEVGGGAIVEFHAGDITAVGRDAVVSAVCGLCSNLELRPSDAGGDRPDLFRGHNRRRLDDISAAPAPMDARGAADGGGVSVSDGGVAGPTSGIGFTVI